MANHLHRPAVHAEALAAIRTVQHIPVPIFRALHAVGQAAAGTLAGDVGDAIAAQQSFAAVAIEEGGRAIVARCFAAPLAHIERHGVAPGWFLLADRTRRGRIKRSDAFAVHAAFLACANSLDDNLVPILDAELVQSFHAIGAEGQRGVFVDHPEVLGKGSDGAPGPLVVAALDDVGVQPKTGKS